MTTTGKTSRVPRRTRAGVVLLAVGLLGVVLFGTDALREDPAIFGVIQAIGAAILVYGGVGTYRGRAARGSLVAVGLFLLALLGGVAGDAVVRGGFTQPVVDTVFVAIFALPTLLAVVLVVTTPSGASTES